MATVALETFDVVVLGSGAAGLSAAITARAAGLSVLVLEKTEYFGGSTAVSGGAVWIPDNPGMAALGHADSREKVMDYLHATVGNHLRADMMAAFLDEGPGMVRFLEQRAGLRLIARPELVRPAPQPRTAWALCGGSAALETRLAVGHGQCIGRAPTARGAAGRGRAPAAGRGHGIGHARRRRVTGVRVNEAAIAAHAGVIIATGGFGQNARLREEYLPHANVHRSMSPAGNTGDGIRLAREAGAAMQEEFAGPAFWAPVSVLRGEDGSETVFPHLIMDRQKPGLMAVNSAGRRFVNEATSYHEFVAGMHRAQEETPCIPGWLICDAAFLRKYGMGLVRPGGVSLKRFIASGYLLEARTLQALAEKIGRAADGRAHPSPERGGEPIPGLYVCGNDMASIMSGTYPAAGITLGPGLTFGYIAGKEVAREAGASVSVLEQAA